MIEKRYFKHARCGYMHADGSVLIVYSERHPKIANATSDYVRLFPAEMVGVKYHTVLKTGRIVFHDIGLLGMICATATSIKMSEHSIVNGSENTRKRDIAVGTMVLYTDYGYCHFSTFPDLISAAWTYQPDNGDNYASLCELTRWCDSPMEVIQPKWVA